MPVVHLNTWLQMDEFEWSASHLWQDMGFLGRGTVILLCVMLVQTMVIACSRLVRYHAARSQSRAFVHGAVSQLNEGQIEHTLALAALNTKSHVGAVISSGLASWLATPSNVTHAEAIESACRQMKMAQRRAAADLHLGLGTLATISVTAPFIGLFGTVIGILGAFREYTGPKWLLIAITANGLAEALVTTAAGLLVAISSVWLRNYLCERVQVFATEMSNAMLETVTLLEAHPEWQGRNPELSQPVTLFDTVNWAEVQRWEIQYDTQRALLLTVGFCVFYLGLVIAVAVYTSGT